MTGGRAGPGGRTRRSTSTRGGAEQARAPLPREPFDCYLTNPATEELLSAELSTLRKDARAVAAGPGVLALPAGALVDPAFARQVLPDARLFQAKSASELALRIVAAGDDKIARLDVLVPEVARRGSREPERSPLLPSADLLRDELRGKIEGRGLSDPAGVLLQVVLLSGWSAVASRTRTTDAPPLLAWPAAFPGGRAAVEGDRYAPSSAHRKLEEALRWLGVEPAPDELCLDLGAAPGGWSHALLQRGARVVAVDRAEMDRGIAAHPKLTHVRKDAFSYVPDEKPAWLVCDVIALPERSLKLVEDALGSPKLRAVVVTVKLKKPWDLAAVARARAIARGKPGFWGRAKHLVNNKLELTIMMRRAG